ncbi:MAG TPA: HAD-IA family hydrolase [Thermoanaerobaculia bacterium]
MTDGLRRPLLFFDIDDTLVDHRGAEEGAQRETFERYPDLVAGLSFDEWLSTYRAKNRPLWDAYGRGEITRQVVQHRRFFDPLEALGRDASRADEVGDFYLSRYRAHWTLNDGAEEALEAASRLGFVGLLSNGFVEQQQGKIARFGLDRWARAVILSEEVGAMKPDRRIFDAAIKAARLAGAGVDGRRIYVGDSYPHDVVGARAAGWDAILYNPSAVASPEPVAEVRTLREVAALLEGE